MHIFQSYDMYNLTYLSHSFTFHTNHKKTNIFAQPHIVEQKRESPFTASTLTSAMLHVTFSIGIHCLNEIYSHSTVATGQ